MAPTVAELVSNTMAHVSLPSVVARLSNVREDPQSTPQEIAEVISDDVVLTAKLLRVVNAAIPDGVNRVNTVDQAVTRFGVDFVVRVILATAVKRYFQNVPEGMDGALLWTHSLACAVGAGELATRAGSPNPDRAFVAGLLHDVGTVGLYLGHPKRAALAREAAITERKPLHVSEQELWGYDHAGVGLALVRMWGLCDEIEEAVALHHTLDVEATYPVSTAAVQVSDALAHVLLMGSGAVPCVPPVSRRAWRTLSVAADDIPTILRDLENNYARLALVLD